MTAPDSDVAFPSHMMDDLPLTTNLILDRADTLFGGRPVYSAQADGTVHRSTYREVAARARSLAVALGDAGIRPGDRVATLCMNHHQHLELYFAVPGMGAVLHTVNPRLNVEDLLHIFTEAQDRAVVVDRGLWPVWAQVRDRVRIPFEVVVEDGGPLPSGALTFEDLLSRGDPSRFVDAVVDERAASGMCYTSGTTGQPKGVVYSHRSLVLHAIGAVSPDVMNISERDAVMPIVPMFHVNAWGFPYQAALQGAALVLPGPNLAPAAVLTLAAETGTTLMAGVPTVFLGMLAELDRNPGRYRLDRLKTAVVGGSALPGAVLAGLRRHGISALHAWGMTETSPLGSAARVPVDDPPLSEEEAERYRLTQGRPAPFIQIRARGDQGLLPWDNTSLGELEVRGPWVASDYFGGDQDGKFTQDGWFKTGDVVAIDPRGAITIHDRAKDLVKSGGEWISSVALENALMGHPAVAEAAVIAVHHPRWQERPLAVLVARGGDRPSDDELRAHLAERFKRWWFPDAFVWVDAIPRTATGKFLKSALRERYRDALAGLAEGPE
jgi:fatty-acyl-CoA synthase